MEERLRKVILAGVSTLYAATVFAAAPVAGMPAPDFVLPSLGDANLRLSEYRSDVVVLNFWGPNCARCDRAAALLNALYEQHREAGLHMLSISIDGKVDRAREFALEQSIGYPMLLDQDYAVSRLYDLGRLPVTVVIDRNGNVVHVDEGFRRDGGVQITAAVTQLMQD